MIKGLALNDERFIKGNKYDSKYFDELLERIKTIRISERMAKKYWEYEDKTEQEDDKYLYIGKIKIIKELI